MSPTINKYITYYRVSTNKQANSGLGLEAQEQIVKGITDKGEVIATFTEIESGKKADRPKLQEAINMCKEKKAILLVAKLDRLSRSISFIANLMDSKVKFVCADTPEMDNFTIHLFAAMAERERVLISERTAAGLNSIKVRIRDNGYHVTKNGRIIKSLGNPAMQDPKDAKVLMGMIAKKRKYTKKSDIGVELIKAYSQNGVPVKEIKNKLLENGISLSLKSIYKYVV
jgi:DNA invertase Pin-like site-specific DNA recombinase